MILLKVEGTIASTAVIVAILDVYRGLDIMINLDEFAKKVDTAIKNRVHEEVDEWPKWKRDIIIEKLKKEGNV
jgi:hypothetical protein